jgi:hypothetical protein
LVLSIHTRQIEKFGGTEGIRDEGLLESALAQPQVTFGGQLLHPSIPAQAAAYLYLECRMNAPVKNSLANINVLTGDDSAGSSTERRPINKLLTGIIIKYNDFMVTVNS